MVSEQFASGGIGHGDAVAAGEYHRHFGQLEQIAHLRFVERRGGRGNFRGRGLGSNQCKRPAPQQEQGPGERRRKAECCHHRTGEGGQNCRAPGIGFAEAHARALAVRREGRHQDARGLPPLRRYRSRGGRGDCGIAELLT